MFSLFVKIQKGNGLNFSMKISKIFFLSIVCIFILSFGIGCDGASVEIEGSEIGSDAQVLGETANTAEASASVVFYS